MKYIIGIVMTVLALTNFSYAQRVTFNKGGTLSKNYYVELPYELTNGYLFVNVEMNGIKRKFLVDTGAPLQITSALFGELKPAVINSTEITDASGNKANLDIVNLKEINLNGLTFSDVPALVSNSELYACFDIDGVIGSNLFRNTIVRFESLKHLIILTDDETKANLNKNQASGLISGEPQSYPYFKVGLTGKSKQLVGFDTGSPYFMVTAETHARKNIKDQTAERISSGYGTSSRSLLGIQKKDSLLRIVIPSMTVAGAEFKDVTAETNKSGKTRLGNRLLNYGNVTIDYIHNRFYFEPFNEINVLAEKQWPLKPVVFDHKLVAGVVWEKLSGQVTSLDQIIAIDGEICETVDLCDWLKGGSAAFNSKNNAVLTIRDEKGNSKKIAIVKE